MTQPRYIKYLEGGEYKYASVKDAGDLALLQTFAKDDLVSAINELFLGGGASGIPPEVEDRIVDLENQGEQQATDLTAVTDEAINLKQKQEEMLLKQAELVQKANDLDVKTAEIVADVVTKAGLEYVDGELVKKIDTTKYDAEYQQITTGLLEKVDITKHTNDYNTIIQDLDAKVDSIEFDPLKGRMVTVENDIVAIEGEISTRITKTEFDDAVGLNKWAVSKYPVVNTDLGQTIPSFQLIRGMVSTETIEVDDAVSLPIFTGTNHVSHFFTNIYLKVAKTIALNVKYDDSIAVYMNGASVYEGKYNGMTTVPVSLSLRAGWNTVEILHGQAIGTPLLDLGVTISPQVDKMTTVIGVGDKNETRLSQAETQIKQTEESILLKAEKTVVENIGNKVTANEASIEVMSDEIASKVNQIAFDAYSQRVTNAESTIVQHSDQIASKVAQATYDLLNNRVGTAETTITQNTNSIALKVSQTDFDGLQSRVSSAETAIDLNEEQIALKATKTELSTVDGRLTTAEGSLTVANNQIATKVSQTAYDTKVSELNALATNAQNSATTANNLLGDLASDSKLTAVEKQEVKREWDVIVAEKVSIDAQATTYGITTEKTNYGTSYTTLSNYITPLLANLATTSDIVGTTFRTNFKDYYDKRTILNKKVVELAKSLADTAQTGVNTANSNIASLTTRVDATETSITQTSDSITLKADKSTTYTKTDVDDQIDQVELLISNQGTQITQTNEAINLKASKTDVYTKVENDSLLGDKTNTSTFNALVTRVSTAETEIDQTAGAITLKANATDVYTKAESNTELNKKANQTDVTAVTNSLNDMSSDLKVTPLEKGLLKTDWEKIKAEYAELSTQATSLGVVQTNFGNAYTAMNGTTPKIEAEVLLTMTTTYTFGTTVLRDAFKTKFKTYFSELEKIRKALTDKVNTTAGTANTTANTANGTANTLRDTTIPALTTRVSSAESSLTVQADQIALKVAQTDFDALGNRMANAESSITTTSNEVALKATKTEVTTAQSKADSAFTNAGTANSLLSDIASDSKLTASEKKATKKEWDAIVSEKVTIDAQATTYAITTEKTTYGNAYSALSTYVTPLLADLTVTSTIVGTTFRSTFKTYYDAKVSLLKKVSDLSKSLADGAQGTANTANGTANTLRDSTVPALTTRISTAESSITTQAGQIALKVAQTDFNNATSTESMTKTNGTELLNLDFKSNLLTTKLPFVGTYTIAPATEVTGGTVNEANLIKTVNAQFLYTPYLAVDANSPNYFTMEVFNLTTNTGTVYAQSCYYDKNKVELSTNESALNLIGGIGNTSANTWQKHEGYLAPLISTDIRQRAVYTRIRVLTRYNNLTGTTYLRNPSWKQLNPQTIADSLTRISIAESSIVQTANDITLKVAKTDYNGTELVSMINQTPSTVKIQAKNVDITGAVTFSSFDTSTKGILSNSNGAIINDNPNFLDWTGTNPVGYSQTAVTGLSKVASGNGMGNSVQYVVIAGTNSYLTPTTVTSHPYYQYLVVDFIFNLTSGTIGGAGILLRYNATTLIDNLIPISSAVPTPVLNKWHTVTKVVKVASATATAGFTGYSVFPMGAFTSLGTITAKTIQFDSLKVRPASEQEINAYETGVNVTSNKATWDRAGNINSDGTYNTTKLSGTLTDAQVASGAKWNTASTDATNSKNAIADMATDSILSPAEKTTLRREWETIIAEKVPLETQATAYEITTEKTAYTTAYNTLNTYVPPFLTVMTTNSAIVGTTFRANFKNYYVAKVNLIKKMTDIASAWKAIGKTTIDGGKIETDSILVGALKAGVISADKFTISNAKVVIDSTGVTVNDANFLVKDVVSGTKYSVDTKRNLVKDHSFEMIQHAEGFGAYGNLLTATNPQNNSGIGWQVVGYPEVRPFYDIDGANQWIMFGNKSAVVDYGSYYRQDIPIVPLVNYPYAISFYATTPVGMTAGIPKLTVEWWTAGALSSTQSFTFPIPSTTWGQKTRYSASVVVPNPLTYNTNSFMRVYVNTPTTSTFTEIDGFQVVEGTVPTTYNDEASLWEITTGQQIAEYVRIRDLEADTVSAMTKMFTTDIDVMGDLNSYGKLNLSNAKMTNTYNLATIRDGISTHNDQMMIQNITVSVPTGNLVQNYADFTFPRAFSATPIWVLSSTADASSTVYKSAVYTPTATGFRIYITHIHNTLWDGNIAVQVVACGKRI